MRSSLTRFELSFNTSGLKSLKDETRTGGILIPPVSPLSSPRGSLKNLASLDFFARPPYLPPNLIDNDEQYKVEAIQSHQCQGRKRQL